MKAAVLTPTLGESSWLNQALESVRALGPQVESIVVCPRDAESRILQRWPGVRVVTDDGRGLYAALNRGLKATADMDAVTWLNDDDVLDPAGTSIALKTLADDPAVDGAYGWVEMIGGDGEPCGRIPVARRAGDWPALFVQGIVPLAQPGTWLRADLFRKLGGFDESFRLAGDLDLFSRAVLGGAGFLFVPAVVARFRLRAGQLSKDEAVGDEEKRRALAAWRTRPRSRSAVWRFRCDNLGVYFDRIRRHGFVSMRQVYRKQ